MTSNDESAGEAVAAKVVVAIGAPPSSHTSLENLLARMVLPDDVAVVVVLQHREALDREALQGRLVEDGGVITPAADAEPIEAGKIYLHDPDVIVTAERGHFRIRPAEQVPGERGMIDSFLVSLAQDEGRRSVAVLLAGTGTDGTLGVTAVKEAGGLVIAEEIREHPNESLASSSSPIALADFIFNSEELPNRVSFHVRRFVRQEANATLGTDRPDIVEAITSIAAILRSKTGHDFHGYKRSTFLRRIQRRMQVTQAEDILAYIDILRSQPDEVQQLFNDLLIGVTQFFRDPKEFELLEARVIPKIFEGKAHHDQIRIWVIGCSTGEEAYSLAILLREQMAKMEEVPHVQIFATDLDGRALASARAGRYTDAVAKDVTPERLARWFVKEGNTYCVVKDLREMCIFSQHSLIKDPPFSRLDMVSCRNLLIYLDADLQSRVIPLFHFALKSGGYLFLGNSENVSRHTSLFAPIENRFRIFQRQETATRILPDFPVSAAVDCRLVETTPLPQRPRAEVAVLTRRAERLVERYAPAYVITDEAFDVLHFSSRMGRYIEPVGGAATLNLLNLVHPELRLDIRAALARAAEQNQTVHVPNLNMRVNGDRLLVDLVVEPTQETPNAARSFVVLFKDGAVLPETEDYSLMGVPPHSAQHVQQLDAELRATRERLQATIEELESTNEELKSCNEEYQSLNEELETFKEELQSVNEDLTTVNGELGHRVQELARANSDLKNLLESTQIATIFLDNDLRVMNYTPAIVDVFHLIESDIGRPISHIKSRVAYDDLQDDARKVLRSLGSVEREIEAPASRRHYMMRVLPYRSTDNFIAGVVLTFVDITARKRAEEALQDREERFRMIVEAAQDYGIFTVDQNGRIDEWWSGATAVFGWATEEIIGKDLSIVYTPEDKAAGVPEQELAQARQEGMAPDVRWHLRKDGTRVFIEGFSRALHDPSGRFHGVMKIGQDVTERRRNEERLRESESQAKLLLAELQHRVRNTLAVVRSIAQRSAVNSETVEDYAAHLDGRLNAFARVQAVTTRDPGVGLDLEMLVADELTAHAAREGEQVIRIGGPKVRLQHRAAETLGLVFHELATNAVKYGALSAPQGRVEVHWQLDGKQDKSDLVLNWLESGVQLDGTPPTRRGFGSELIKRTLGYELNGEASLDFDRDGLKCQIRLPVTDRLIMPPSFGQLPG